MKNNKGFSKKNIIYQLSKRFETTIIGSLARVEDTFGYLWGHNSDKDPTEKQKEFEDLWEFTRTNILNHGNKQMREAIDEIVDYLEEEERLTKYRVTLINNKDTDFTNKKGNI